MMIKRTGKNTEPKELHLSRARLDALVDDALTDAYGESEQVTGFYTMLENDLQLPFETQIRPPARERRTLPRRYRPVQLCAAP
jgi:hypothetical protein